MNRQYYRSVVRDVKALRPELVLNTALLFSISNLVEAGYTTFEIIKMLESMNIQGANQ
jgi:hypothetical protein